ncbi:MAG: hypothetical protein R6X34_06845 [Chloroflexota bacterium]
MMESQNSTVFLHEDGYVEMVFAGLQSTSRLRVLVEEAKAFASSNEGVVNLLIDGRNGRIGRDARTFTLLMDVGWVRNLQHIVILYSDDPNNENSARPSDIIVTVLTNVLRVQPYYTSDEAEARRIVNGQNEPGRSAGSPR